MNCSPSCVPVFVIFLKRRPRSDALCAALARLDIPFELVAAADMRNVDADALAAVYDAERAMRRVGRAMGRGEIGCALSHCDVYKRMLARNIPLALILEEDAVPEPNFKSVWEASFALPEHIDVLSLYTEDGCIERRRSGMLAGTALHAASVMLPNTVGYFIRLRCAERLLLSNTPVSMVADWPLDLPSMRQFLSIPMLVSHPATLSNIALERPQANILRRFRAPHWISGLFHLSFLGYAMQPNRYEGLRSYYRREVARRLRRISSPNHIDIPAYLARSGKNRPSFTLLRHIGSRLRHIVHAAVEVASGRDPLPGVLGRRRAHVGTAARNARLKIGCYGNWPDFQDALRFLTPGASAVWNDVAFVPAGSMQTDWIGIFNQPKKRTIEFSSSPERIFFAIGEPPTRMHRPLHVGQGLGSIIFTCDQELVARSTHGRNFVLTPPMLRTWSVRRSLEQLSPPHGG